MTANGYAGDTRPVLLAHLALTSRLLERPINLAFVAMSASGKNRTVDEALRLMPDNAFHQITASSPRALVYSGESFQHRMVVLAEADSLPREGPAASAVRSIAADRRMVYEVVEKNPVTNEFETRRIEKEGPTGLITTSTESMDRQFATRTLEVPIPDDDEQTQAVMEAHARQVAGEQQHEPPDTVPFHALQRWLEAGGTRNIEVPFAGVLAELVPPNAVGMRRWFRLLLTAIQTVALLHQRQRERTDDGAVVATLEDYEEAREILRLVFGTVAAEGVTDAVRETVEAIQPGERVSQAELADRLDISAAAVSYRVKRAIQGGWLVNEESRRGYAHKLTRGAPLPEDRDALPGPEAVKEALTTGETRDDSDNAPSDKDVDEGVKGTTAETGEGAPRSLEEETRRSLKQLLESRRRFK